MRLYRLLTAILLAVSPLAASAIENKRRAYPRDFLSTRDDFAFFARNWSYLCDSADIVGYDPRITDHMRGFFEDRMYAGLKSLEKINPVLIHDAMRRTAAEGRDRLTINCESSGDGVASYGSPLNESMNGVIKLGLVAYDLAVSHDADALRRLGRTREDSYFARHKAYLSMAAFHEFLHFLGLDNYESIDHNLYIFKRDHGVEEDVVYACAVQAFPTGDYPIVKYRAESYSNTRLACETCARAFPGASLSVLDRTSEGEDRARRACGALDETSFLIPD